jgi:hypothetical protein
VAPQPELEHRDIPADRTDPELALTEQRPAPHPERSLGPAADETRCADSPRTLERDERPRRLLSAHTVDGTRIEPVGAEPDLESGDASTGREPAGSEHENANEHRDADDGEATHGITFAA